MFNKKHKTLAVVLSTGNVRSLAALPLLEMLEKQHVPIDLIVGSGGGAVMGALFAAGFPLKDIPGLMLEIFQRRNFEKTDYLSLYKMLGIKNEPEKLPPAILKDEKFKIKLLDIFKDMKMANLRYPLIVQATDMFTGEAVTLDSGSVAENVYASTAIYPFLPPIKKKNKLLVGGVFTAALPLMTAVKYQADIIIGMRLTALHQIQCKGFIEYVIDFLNRTFLITQGRQITFAINSHNGEIKVMGVDYDPFLTGWETSKLEMIIEAGRKTISKHEEELQQLIDQVK